jgi:hypothetical protein
VLHTVQSAELLAGRGEVSQAVKKLSGASKWILSTAKEIGVPVVIELLKKLLS